MYKDSHIFFYHLSIYHLKANVPDLERSRDRRDRGNKQLATKGEAKEIKLPCLGKQTTGRKEKQQR
jgi:hypothetical protein